MSNRYLAGLDLGQAADFTALLIAERVSGERRRPCYDVRHIQRWPLGTPYPAIVADVVATFARPELARQARLIVDGTGVGRAVVDLFRAERTLRRLVPVAITGGALAAEQADGWWHVPKKELVATVQVLLQQRRLRFAQGLPETALLTGELQSFQVNVTANANETFSAREGQHDDLVLALALACWYGEHEPPHVGFPPSILAGRGVKVPPVGPPRRGRAARGNVTRHEDAASAIAAMQATAHGE